MIQLTLYSLTLIMSFIFLQMNHPLSMGLMLLIQTLIICMMTGLISKTFWFSYILFLVFLGGMLVLFIYVTSLASNEMFTLSMNLTLISIIMMSISFFIYLLIDWNSIIYTSTNPDSILTSSLNLSMKENTLTLTKLYNYPTNYMTILLITYLFITLITIVKITNMFYGPLRPMN